ncbi:MAG: glycoside hydrolase family 99-like domain-containing protein, partial [Thermoguttaceae bacterium]
GIVTGRDPFFIVTGLDIPARPWNLFQARLRIVQDQPLVQQAGELFYANSTEGPYGGFSQAKTGVWTAPEANTWEVVRIYPFWSKEGKIVKLRLDFPAPAESQVNKAAVEIDWIEIVDLKLENQPEIQPAWTVDGGVKDAWQSPMFSLDTEQIGNWLTVGAAVDAPRSAEFSWMNGQGGFHSTTVKLKKNATGLYNVDLAGSKYWKGRVHQFKLRTLPDSESSDSVTFRSVALNRQPQGPACIDVLFCGIEDAMVRAGYETAFFLDLVNCGGQDAPPLTLGSLELPEGVSLTAAESEKTIEPLKIGERRRMLFPLKATEPVEGTISLKLTPPGRELASVPVEIPISVLPSLNLPRADYVPEPKPVKSEYEIGALYFPGWYQGHSWSRVWSRCPERRPLLGWYNESSPEVIDWQIKWSVENGIQFYLVDWYWNKGSRHLEHWIQGFQQARYKSYLKWAMMWANHNGPGSHSLEDQANVTKYWIDNYFKTPEYYTIDGRPVVMVWSPEGMDRDVIEIEKKKGNELAKGQGVKKLLDLSQKMAKEAGLKGIYFVAMKWPEASTSAADIQWLADAGFEMTSIYHFMDDGGKAATRRKFSFDLVVEASKPFWERWNETGILPFLPNLSTGWDDRPWNDSCWIAERTPAKFGEICRRFKQFSKETGIKRAVLAPVNEWGEGSYAEPCREFGFGMYEAIRENLCEKAQSGWPLNFGPKDVGLGPYEYTEGAVY